MLAKFVIYEAGLYGLWSAWSMEGWGGGRCMEGGGGDVWKKCHLLGSGLPIYLLDNQSPYS